MQRIGNAISKLLTYISLLASIGSFVIAALPLVPPDHTNQTTIHRRLEESAESGLRAGKRAVEQQASNLHARWAERRERIIKSCLLIIVSSALGLAVIRLTKPR
jgi:hypothetical protein